MDYSKTVFLPTTDFPMKADLPKREPLMLETWEKEKVYEKALKRREGKEKFILHDGPPYANGHLHLGHALNKILKDIIVRYKTMAGFYAPYVPGWDCHGLPIELQLMKELKVTDKHKVDREQFRAQAKDFAQKFVDIQRQEFKRMGVQGDWEHPYLTMNEEFKKTIVDTFKDLEAKGYVYRGKKPVYWCSSDETALAEAEVEYENDTGPSIYVAFRLKNFPDLSGNTDKNESAEEFRKFWQQEDTFFVIWTTTPWTLPANVAIAFNPSEQYGLYRDRESNKRYIVAEKLEADFAINTEMKPERLGLIPGALLEDAQADHPWISDRTVRLLPADFVAMDTGTGLVHIAPGHGREDFQLGQKFDLPVLSPVNDRGLFTDEVPEWKGEHVFKANLRIVEFLKEKGRLLYCGQITHSYPHCWRCHKPVIFRATEQWFLDIDKQNLRQRLLKALETVKFFPEFGRNRITGMVESRPDWCLSRQRLWGTEIPTKVPQKEPDIFDVWFESGVSWAAVLKKRHELSYPADMYLEGSDQHRGWFQVSLIPSVALENQAPFKSLLTHGFVMDGQGRPMSKSLGNVIAPDTIIQQYGADILRLWVASSDYSGDVRLSQDILKNQAEAYRKIRNTLRYLLSNLSDFDAAKHAVPLAKLPEIDRWALHRLQEETRDALQAYERYEFHRVMSRLVNYCVADLSSYYLDILKDRLYCDPIDSLSRRAAQTVLDQIASNLIRLMAPILPFTAEECWRFWKKPDSVTLADLPAVDAAKLDQQVADHWTALLKVRDVLLVSIEKARAAGKVKAAREVKAAIRVQKAETLDFLKRYGVDLPVFLGISQATVASGATTEAVEVEIEPVQGAKCARCWIYKTDIGSVSQYPEVCRRCADAVALLTPS